MSLTRQPSVDGSSRLLDTQAAAAYLGLAKNTLDVWRAKGRYGLPFVRVGRCVRYRQEDLDAWIESQVRTGG